MNNKDLEINIKQQNIEKQLLSLSLSHIMNNLSFL